MEAVTGPRRAAHAILPLGSRGRQACEKSASRYATSSTWRAGPPARQQAGLPVVRGKDAISLERQVRIAAGSLVLLARPWGLGIRLLGRPGSSAGLVFAGVTEICGLGTLLAGMPWNEAAGGEARADP